MVLQWALRALRRQRGAQGSVRRGKAGGRAPVWKAEAARAGAPEGRGARAGDRGVLAAAPPHPPPRPGPRGPYLHVLLLPWHSKLSNRHSAVLHSSSHWPFT